MQMMRLCRAQQRFIADGEALDRVAAEHAAAAAALHNSQADKGPDAASMDEGAADKAAGAAGAADDDVQQ